MKKDFGSKTWIFPMPVLMIGTYDEKGVANMMNAAWGGCSLEDEISICIDNTHKTWANIVAKKAFSISRNFSRSVSIPALTPTTSSARRLRQRFHAARRLRKESVSVASTH